MRCLRVLVGCEMRKMGKGWICLVGVKSFV